MGTRLENADGMGSTQFVPENQSITIATDHLEIYGRPGVYEVFNLNNDETGIFENTISIEGEITLNMKPLVLIHEESGSLPVERDGVTYIATVANFIGSSNEV